MNVNNISTPPTWFVTPSLEETQPSITEDKSVHVRAEKILQKIALLRKQVEDKDRIIANMSLSINRLTDAAEANNMKIAHCEEKVTEKDSINVELETRVAFLEQELQKYRLANVHPVENSDLIVEEPTLSQIIRDGFLAVGSFCKRHVLFINAAIGFVSLGLALAFPPFGVAIGLGGAAAVALINGCLHLLD